jgi:DNA-directed RNA polymerase sigma subunit (sigma70/sigma32)
MIETNVSKSRYLSGLPLLDLIEELIHAVKKFDSSRFSTYATW